MNIMIAAVGINSGFGAIGGTAEGALFIAVFSGIGCALFLVAGRLTNSDRDQRPEAVRYTFPRL